MKDPKARFNIVVLSILCCLASMLSGCVVNSKITQTGGTTGDTAAGMASVVPVSTKVWVLTPKVVYEDTLTETLLASSAQGGPALVTALTEQTVAILNGKGFHKVVTSGDSNLSAEQHTLAEQASLESNHLVRANPSPQVIKYIQGLASTNESVAVLAQYVRIKVGPHGTWDPNSGAITSGASTSYFRATLLEAQTGRRLWGNSVLLREVAKPNNSNFKTTGSLLFSNLNLQN